jgi:hypothetical protein
MDSATVDTSKQLDHRSYVLEIVIAVVLGLSTVGAAYAAYQASLYGGSALDAYSLVLVKTNDTNAAHLKADQALTMDMLSYNQYKALTLAIAQAKNEKDQDTAYGIAQVFKDENLSGTFAKAVTWSDEKDLKEKVYVSPLTYQPYLDELEEPSRKLAAERDRALSTARQLNDTGDQFTLMTVLFTIVLFFTGIAAVFKRDPVKITLLVVATLLLVVTAGRLFTLPAA